jgi:hypothetical protein
MGPIPIGRILYDDPNGVSYSFSILEYKWPVSPKQQDVVVERRVN